MIDTNKFEFDATKKYSPISYRSESKMFTAFGSDLYWKFDVNQEISITNVLTKNTIKFTLKETKKDSDNDVQVWIFKSISGSKFPCELHILND